MMEPPIRTNEGVVTTTVDALVSYRATNKRDHREISINHHHDTENHPSKVARMNTHQPVVPVHGPLRPTVACNSSPDADSRTESRPYPYFFYRDFSTVADPDPFVPLTSPGRVPNFPAKMHSILSRSDLADVVAWMPHGRSWRVLKPREFEINVIPTYFEHAKFSSFIRQANGWGFRRITQGQDRNSYYHEMFLRGLPHLCKMMKRPGVAEKQSTDPDHEPDLFKISEEKPVPERAEDESILLHCTLQGGPKARMPVCLSNLSRSTQSSSSSCAATTNAHQVSSHQDSFSPQMSSAPAPQHVNDNATATSYNNHAVHGQHSDNYNYAVTIPAMQNSNVSGSSANFTSQAQPQCQQHQQHLHPAISYPQGPYNVTSPTPAPNPINSVMVPVSQNQLIAPTLTVADTSISPNGMAMYPMALQGNSSAAAQFAAGFVAATALSTQNFRQILGQALAALPSNNIGTVADHPNQTHNGQQPCVLQQAHQQQQVPVTIPQRAPPPPPHHQQLEHKHF